MAPKQHVAHRAACRMKSTGAAGLGIGPEPHRHLSGSAGRDGEHAHRQAGDESVWIHGKVAWCNSSKLNRCDFCAIPENYFGIPSRILKKMEIRTLTYGVSVNRKFTIAGSLAAFEPIVFNSTPSPVRDVFGRFGLDWLPPVSVRNKTLQAPDKCW